MPHGEAQDLRDGDCNGASDAAIGSDGASLPKEEAVHLQIHHLPSRHISLPAH